MVPLSASLPNVMYQDPVAKAKYLLPSQRHLASLEIIKVGFHVPAPLPNRTRGVLPASSPAVSTDPTVVSLKKSYHYKNGNIAESRSYSEPKISALYEKYKDDEEDCVLSDGIEEFCIDLQLKPDEFKVLGKTCTV